MGFMAIMPGFIIGQFAPDLVAALELPPLSEPLSLPRLLLRLRVSFT